MLSLLLSTSLCSPAAVRSTTLDEWRLVASASLPAGEGGAALSAAGYNASAWLPVHAPATVMAGLLQNDVYRDPFHGTNLKAIPTEQFAPPNTWWYRADVAVPAAAAAGGSVLALRGINYRASV